MTAISIVGISGSVIRPSRTGSLVRTVLETLSSRIDATTRLIELVDAASALFDALTPDRLDGEAKAIVRAVESADLLVVGTPVYRASYTGALKHLFDLIRHDALAGKPIILAATGGSHLHGLVTEHQLRPLFGFFNALSLPTAVYATEADFRDYRIVNPAINDRIERAVTEAVGLFRTRSPLRITPDIHAARLPAAVNA